MTGLHNGTLLPTEDWECDECGYDGDCKWQEGRLYCPSCGRRAKELEVEEVMPNDPIDRRQIRKTP